LSFSFFAALFLAFGRTLAGWGSASDPEASSEALASSLFSSLFSLFASSLLSSPEDSSVSPIATPSLEESVFARETPSSWAKTAAQ